MVEGILKFGDVSFQVGKTIYVGLYWFKKRDGECEALGRPLVGKIIIMRPLVVGNIIIIIEGSFFSMVPKDLNSLELKKIHALINNKSENWKEECVAVFNSFQCIQYDLEQLWSSYKIGCFLDLPFCGINHWLQSYNKMTLLVKRA